VLTFNSAAASLAFNRLIAALFERVSFACMNFTSALGVRVLVEWKCCAHKAIFMRAVSNGPNSERHSFEVWGRGFDLAPWGLWFYVRFGQFVQRPQLEV